MLQTHFDRSPVPVGGPPAHHGLVASTSLAPYATIWILSVEGFSVQGTGVGVGYLQFHATDGNTGYEPAAGAVPQFQIQVPEGATFDYRPPNGRRMADRGSSSPTFPNYLVWAISSSPYVYTSQAGGRMVVDVEFVKFPVLPA